MVWRMEENVQRVGALPRIGGHDFRGWRGADREKTGRSMRDSAPTRRRILVMVHIPGLRHLAGHGCIRRQT
ncbi:hypothetical protein JCM14124_18530 [Humidesulfovibrio idahonensis]